MKVQLLSDNHFEHYTDYGARLLKELDPSGVDVLVIAGDMLVLAHKKSEEVLKELCSKYPQVVYVLGNHEFYGAYPQAVFNLMQEFESKIPNLHWLEDKMIEINGIKFAGGTLWFRKQETHFKTNDFRAIPDFENWVYDKATKTREFLTQVASEADVIITHHIPAEEAVSERFKNLRTKNFFCCDMTDLMKKEKPPLWLFGHTHDRKDIWIDKTRIISNPKGYPFEPEGIRGIYHPKLILDVQPRDKND